MNQQSHQQEIERIKSVYKKRKESGLEDQYSLDHPAIQYFHHQRMKDFKSILEEECMLPFNDQKIFEIGYGSGKWFKDFITLGASEEQLYGIELDEVRADYTRKQYPKAHLLAGDASYLDCEDESFNLVLQATAFSSILNLDMQRKVASEMLRIVKNNGMILWYDFFVDNPYNPDVQGIQRGKIKELFPGCAIRTKRVTLAPPLSRLLAPVSSKLCHGLEQLKIFNTHYFAVIRKEL